MKTQEKQIEDKEEQRLKNTYLKTLQRRRPPPYLVPDVTQDVHQLSLLQLASWLTSKFKIDPNSQSRVLPPNLGSLIFSFFFVFSSDKVVYTSLAQKHTPRCTSSSPKPARGSRLQLPRMALSSCIALWLPEVFWLAPPLVPRDTLGALS